MSKNKLEKINLTIKSIIEMDNSDELLLFEKNNFDPMHLLFCIQMNSLKCFMMLVNFMQLNNERILYEVLLKKHNGIDQYYNVITKYDIYISHDILLECIMDKILDTKKFSDLMSKFNNKICSGNIVGFESSLIENNKLEYLKKILEINHPDHILLTKACELNKIKIVKYLLECNIDANLKTENCLYPIMISLQNSNYKLTKLLIDYNTNINVIDKINIDGQSEFMNPLMFMIHNSKNQKWSIFMSCFNLLVDKGCNKMFVSNLNNNLMDHAIRIQSVPIIRLLLDEGLNFQTNDILKLGCYEIDDGTSEIFDLMISNNCDPFTNDKNHNFLWKVIEKGNFPSVEHLFDKILYIVSDRYDYFNQMYMYKLCYNSESFVMIKCRVLELSIIKLKIDVFEKLINHGSEIDSTFDFNGIFNFFEIWTIDHINMIKHLKNNYSIKIEKTT